MSGKVVPATNIYLKAAPGDSNNSIFQVFGTPTGNNLTGLVGSNYDDGARPPPYTALTVPTAASGNLKLSFFGGKSVFLGAPTTLDIPSFNVSGNKLTTDVSGGNGTSFRVFVGTTDKGSNVLNNVAPGADIDSLITLVSNTYYYISAYGSNATNQTASLLVSNTSRFTSAKAPAPTGVSASAVSVNGLTPTWTGVGNAATDRYMRIGSNDNQSNIADNVSVTINTPKAITLPSNVNIYMAIAIVNAKGVGEYSTFAGPYLTSAPSAAPTVTPTAGTTTKITATIAQASAENGTASFLAKCGTTTAANELVGTAATITSGTAFPSAGFTTAQPSNNLIYLTVASSNSLGVGAYSTPVSFPSTVPPAPTVSGVSATATTITATLSVSGNAPTTYKVILGDATTNPTTLSNIAGPTDISSGSAATVGWGGSNKCYYATFIGSNAAGLGAISTSTFLANWSPSAPVLSITSFTQGSSSIPLCNSQTQATCNGLSYTVTAGKSAGATEFLTTTIAGTSTNRTGFAQTIDVSSYSRRPFTLYYSVTANAGSTNSSNTSGSVDLLGYPLSVSTANPPWIAYFDGDPTGTSVNIQATQSGRILLVVNVYKDDVYAIGSASTSVAVENWSGPDATGSIRFSFNSGGYERRIVALAGSSILSYYDTSYANNPLSTSVYSAANLPTGGTITLRSDGLRVHTITGTSTTAFTIPTGYRPSANSNAYYVWLVGGGGGGGATRYTPESYGGGGGAGGVLAFTSLSYYAYVPLQSGNYSVTIGAGGANGQRDVTDFSRGSNGGDTIFSWSSGGESFVATAKGGGGGASGDSDTGLNGGSTGGGGAGDSEYGGAQGGATKQNGSITSSTYTRLDITGNYNNIGGSGYSSLQGPWPGGGGGGAGGAGGNGSAGGAGGAGKDIYGTIYAAGGNGNYSGASGAANTGNGGSSGNNGGRGGSGVVIIAYYP